MFFYELSGCGFESSCSGVTEGVQVVSAPHPGKTTAAQVKTMFFNESNMHLYQELKREQT